MVAIHPPYKRHTSTSILTVQTCAHWICGNTRKPHQSDHQHDGPWFTRCGLAYYGVANAQIEKQYAPRSIAESRRDCRSGERKSPHSHRPSISFTRSQLGLGISSACECLDRERGENHEKGKSLKTSWKRKKKRKYSSITASAVEKEGNLRRWNPGFLLPFLMMNLQKLTLAFASAPPCFPVSFACSRLCLYLPISLQVGISG